MAGETPEELLIEIERLHKEREARNREIEMLERLNGGRRRIHIEGEAGLYMILAEQKARKNYQEGR